MIRLETVKYFLLSVVSSLLLFLTGIAVPPAGVFLLPFVSQPPLLLGLRYGRVVGLASTAAVAGLLFVVGGTVLALPYLMLAVMVFLLFFSFGRGWSVDAVVTLAAGGMLAAGTAILWYAWGSLSQLAAAVEASVRDHLEVSLSLYKKIGFAAEHAEFLLERSPQLIEFISRILPALAFIGFATVVLVNLFALRRRVPERKAVLFEGEDLKEWKAPELLIWCFILAGFLIFVPQSWGLTMAAVNIFLVSAAFYFFQGLAIISYYFHHKNVPVFWRGLGYALIAFEQLLTLIVVGLGLFDLWGDFRRLNRKDLHPTHIA